MPDHAERIHAAIRASNNRHERIVSILGWGATVAFITLGLSVGLIFAALARILVRMAWGI